jgi:CRP/FNR family transcriptional regulator, cyclic AMP receptor protein
MDSSGLSSSDLFSAMSEEDIEMLFALCQRREFFEGDLIFAEHDHGEELFIIESGRVRISKAVSLSSDHTLGVVERGGILGEMAVIENTNRSATASAQTDGAVLAMDADVFQTLLAEKPELGLKVLRGLALTFVRRLRLTNNLLSDTVAWGLELSGAAGLSFQSLMADSADIQLTLMNSQMIAGRLVKVDKDSDGRMDLMVLDLNNRIHMVPYHAIMEMSFESDLKNIEGESVDVGPAEGLATELSDDPAESKDSEEESD